MSNGIYLVQYTGTSGFGAATLALVNGRICGVDGAGAEYSGAYQSLDGRIGGQIILTVPAGVTLVTGAPISATPYTVNIPFECSATLAEKQVEMIQVTLPSGKVNANIKKVASL